MTMNEQEKYPTIAHCAMNLLNQHPDWTNKKISDEVVRIMGSRTGPGNISWYKGKLKKGELKMSDYLGEGIKVEAITVAEAEKTVELLPELMVSEEDIIKATGIQKMALEFFKYRSDKTFNVLYKRLKPGMVNHAMNLLKDLDSAEDVVSIAFTKIWIKIAQYNKFWNFSTWAYRIVYNEAMQYIRKNKMLISIDGFTHDSGEGAQHEQILLRRGVDVEQVQYDPTWEIDEKEDMHQQVYEKVVGEIHGLSKFYKDIMIDRELNDMKYKQIADKYDININSVKTRIKRARMQIIENNPDYHNFVKARNKKVKAELATDLT